MDCTSSAAVAVVACGAAAGAADWDSQLDQAAYEGSVMSVGRH